MKDFFAPFIQMLRHRPWQTFMTIVCLVLAFNVYFQGGTIVDRLTNHQDTFTRNWLSCEDKKKDHVPAEEVTTCQHVRQARYQEIRNTPRSARRAYLPEIIGDYIEYYL